MSAAMQETFTGPQARLAEVEAERDRWAARVKELERRASVAVTALEGGPVYPKAARDIITKEQVAKLAANGCMIVASGEWVAREATPGEALAAWQSKAADLEVENAKLRAEVKRLRGEVELEYDDEPKPVDLDDAYKAIAKVIHQRNEAREENERVARDNERLRTDLASAEEALRQVDAELTALAEKNEKLRAELRRAEHDPAVRRVAEALDNNGCVADADYDRMAEAAYDCMAEAAYDRMAEAAYDCMAEAAYDRMAEAANRIADRGAPGWLERALSDETAEPVRREREAERRIDARTLATLHAGIDALGTSEADVRDRNAARDAVVALTRVVEGVGGPAAVLSAPELEAVRGVLDATSRYDTDAMRVARRAWIEAGRPLASEGAA